MKWKKDNMLMKKTLNSDRKNCIVGAI